MVTLDAKWPVHDSRWRTIKANGEGVTSKSYWGVDLVENIAEFARQTAAS